MVTEKLGALFGCYTFRYFQKFGVSKFFCLFFSKEINTIKLIILFNKDALNWSKMTVNTFIMLNSIDNNKKGFLSTKSRDPEDWSNDAEN